MGSHGSLLLGGGGLGLEVQPGPAGGQGGVRCRLELGMGRGEAASAADPGALGVLNPCVRAPRHLHARYSTAPAWSAETAGWWVGQAGVVVAAGVEAAAAVEVATVVEAAAAREEGRSAQSCNLSCACLQD